MIDYRTKGEMYHKKRKIKHRLPKSNVQFCTENEQQPAKNHKIPVEIQHSKPKISHNK